MQRRLTVLILALCSLANPWLSSSEAGKKYALVVGVKTYRPGQPLPELPFTENDADGLAEVLKSGGYDVTLMTQSLARTPGKEVLAPLADYIRDQLTSLLDNPFLKDDDVVIIALTGHGVQYERDDGEKKTPRFYFCPADADVGKLKTAAEISDRNHLIDLGELYDLLKGCKAGGKLLLVDACRNDPTKPGVHRSLASNSLPPIQPPPGGTAVFFSCSAHQRSVEDPELKHGVFFHHVIEALQGEADTSTKSRPADGQITLAELSEYASGSTYDFVRKKYSGERQAPELKGEFRVSIPLISVLSVPPSSSPESNSTLPYRIPSDRIPQARIAIKNLIIYGQTQEDADLKAITLAKIATLYAYIGELTDARQKIDEALQVVQQSSRPSAFNKIAIARAKIGDATGSTTTFRDALSVASRITDAEKRSNELLDISNAQVQAGDTAAASRTLIMALKSTHTIASEEERDYAILQCVKIQSEIGVSEQTEAVFQLATECLQTLYPVTEEYHADKRARSLLRLGLAQTALGDLAAARETFQTALQGLSFEKFSHNELIADVAAAQALAGDFSSAMRTVNKIHAEEEEYLHKYRAIGIVGLATAYAKQEMYNESLNALEQIDSNVFAQPYKVLGLCSIAKEIAKSGPHGRAKEILQQAWLLARSIQTDPSGINEAPWAINIVARAQVETGDIAAALNTVHRMPKCSYKSGAFLNIAKAQANEGNLMDATENLQKAIEFAQAGYEDGMNESLVDIVEQQVAMNEFTAATQTMQLITYKYRRNMAIATIARGQAEAGNFSAAWKATEQVSDSGEKSRIERQISIVQATRGDLSPVLERKTAFAEYWNGTQLVESIVGSFDSPR